MRSSVDRMNVVRFFEFMECVRSNNLSDRIAYALYEMMLEEPERSAQMIMSTRGF